MACSTLQTLLAQVVDSLGRALKLRIQLSSFGAMCRLIGAGDRYCIVPESAARRNRDAMNLALVQLTDPWGMRERYILVRNQALLPA